MASKQQQRDRRTPEDWAEIAQFCGETEAALWCMFDALVPLIPVAAQDRLNRAIHRVASMVHYGLSAIIEPSYPQWESTYERARQDAADQLKAKHRWVRHEWEGVTHARP